MADRYYNIFGLSVERQKKVMHFMKMTVEFTPDKLQDVITFVMKNNFMFSIDGGLAAPTTTTTTTPTLKPKPKADSYVNDDEASFTG